ncbi:MAG TPA: pilus assembly protein TadG-related protein [Burkholderiaceae bacterium]
MNGLQHLRRRGFQRRPARQRGVVAIIVGLMIAVLVGFIGLALDGGHLYLTKTELQNAADACALAASYELTGAPTIPAAAFNRADAAGRAVAQLNKFNFQGSPVAASDIAVGFGTALSAGSSWVAAAAAPANAKYVRCTITRDTANGHGIAPYFMQVLGFGPTTVASIATATLAPAQNNCAVPMAICTRGGPPNYGYAPGDWISMDFSQSGGGSANYTGNFRWIDFDPSSTTPGCSGGGAQELACLLAGTGQCSLPAPITGNCTSSGSANPTPGCVGQNGAVNSLDKAYNTRFGVYAPGGGYSIANAPPDYTGNSYSTENWALGRNAYAGSSTGTNFKDARAAFMPITSPASVNPAFYANNDTLATQAQHASNGADRRLVIVPIVDCAGFATGQHAPVRAYACMLMLDPYRRQGNNVTSRLEFLGLSNEPGSPCATSGIAGDTASLGPMVPALVQ